MGINATLLFQVLTFALLVWAMKRLLWDPMMRQMAERSRRLADGETAAERGRLDLVLAERRAHEIRAEAQAKSAQAIAYAERVGAEIADTLKGQARTEAARLVQLARIEIEGEANRLRGELRVSADRLAAAAAARLLDPARVSGRPH
jgi:F-type H+-transporting ATPase subunit b